MLGHAVNNIPIYEFIYSLLELYITESIFRFLNMAYYRHHFRI